jgi:ADP-ribose pyrophosphatase YjhB (NUDIX family)
LVLSFKKELLSEKNLCEIAPGGRSGQAVRMPGFNFTRRVPAGDTHERDVCASCGFIDYQNPKIVVGSVVASDSEVLLCRRAIEPRAGFWTLPAGYLELGETPDQGAAREALEEAEAAIEIEGILGLYTIARLSQVQIIFRARFAGTPRFAPGVETLEAGLFGWDDIPWSEIAFPSVHWALRDWHAGRDAPLGAPARNPPA